jgi:excisionase family DNA binding protein
MTTATLDPTTIAPEETETAAEAALALTSVLARQHDRVEIAAVDQPDESIVVPTAAFELLINVLGEMARGNGVTLMPIEAELTTQEAADLLNVSRPFVVKLIDDRVLPARTVGNRRRVRLRDLLTYKEIDDARRRTIADELVAEAQELGIY